MSLRVRRCKRVEAIESVVAGFDCGARLRD